MLVECPECKNPVSDQAPACPHCGVGRAAITAKPVAIGSRRTATQFVWFFFWLFVGGIGWVLFGEVNKAAGGIMAVGGLFCWLGALVYRMIYT
jgi:hypothetical protein